MNILGFIIKYCNPQSEEEYNSIVNSLLTGNNLDRILASFDFERLSTDLASGCCELAIKYASLAEANTIASPKAFFALRISLLYNLSNSVTPLPSAQAYDKTAKDLLRLLLCSQILSSLLKELGLPSPFDEDSMNPTGFNFGMGGKL